MALTDKDYEELDRMDSMGPAPTPIPPASSQSSGRAAAQEASKTAKHATQAGYETSEETNKKYGWGEYQEQKSTPEPESSYSGYEEPKPSAEDLEAEKSSSYDSSQPSVSTEDTEETEEDTVEVAIPPQNEEETEDTETVTAPTNAFESGKNAFESGEKTMVTGEVTIPDELEGIIPEGESLTEQKKAEHDKEQEEAKTAQEHADKYYQIPQRQFDPIADPNYWTVDTGEDERTEDENGNITRSYTNDDSEDGRTGVEKWQDAMAPIIDNAIDFIMGHALFDAEGNVYVGEMSTPEEREEVIRPLANALSDAKWFVDNWGTEGMLGAEEAGYTKEDMLDILNGNDEKGLPNIQGLWDMIISYENGAREYDMLGTEEVTAQYQKDIAEANTAVEQAAAAAEAASAAAQAQREFISKNEGYWTNNDGTAEAEAKKLAELEEAEKEANAKKAEAEASQKAVETQYTTDINNINALNTQKKIHAAYLGNTTYDDWVASKERLEMALGTYKPSSTDPDYGMGNIDLNARPVLINDDGTYSTVDSITIEEDGQFVLIPTVIQGEDGEWKHVSQEEAEAHYQKTGEHLGKFESEDQADDYAEQLSENQAHYYHDEAAALFMEEAQSEYDSANATYETAKATADKAVETYQQMYDELLTRYDALEAEPFVTQEMADDYNKFREEVVAASEAAQKSIEEENAARKSKDAAEKELNTATKRYGAFSDPDSDAAYLQQALDYVNSVLMYLETSEMDDEELEREAVDYNSQVNGQGVVYGDGNIAIPERFVSIYDQAKQGLDTDLGKKGATDAFEYYTAFEDGKYVAVPAMIQDENGNWSYVSRQEALAHYEATGEYFGKYDSPTDMKKGMKKLESGAVTDALYASYWQRQVNNAQEELAAVNETIMRLVSESKMNMTFLDDGPDSEYGRAKAEEARLNQIISDANLKIAEYKPGSGEFTPSKDDAMRADAYSKELERRNAVKYFNSTIAPQLEAGKGLEEIIAETKDQLGFTMDEKLAAMDDFEKEWREKKGKGSFLGIERPLSKGEQKLMEEDFAREHPEFSDERRGVNGERERAFAQFLMENAANMATNTEAQKSILDYASYLLGDNNKGKPTLVEGGDFFVIQMENAFNAAHPEYKQAVDEMKQALDFQKSYRAEEVFMFPDGTFMPNLNRDKDYDKKVEVGMKFVDVAGPLTSSLQQNMRGPARSNDSSARAHAENAQENRLDLLLDGMEGISEEQKQKALAYAEQFGTARVLPDDTWSYQELRTFAYYVGNGDLLTAMEFAKDQNNRYDGETKEARLREVEAFSKKMGDWSVNGDFWQSAAGSAYTAASLFLTSIPTAFHLGTAESIDLLSYVKRTGELPVYATPSATEFAQAINQGRGESAYKDLWKTQLHLPDWVAAKIGSANLDFSAAKLLDWTQSAVQAWMTIKGSQALGGAIGQMFPALANSEKAMELASHAYVTAAFAGGAYEQAVEEAYARTGDIKRALESAAASVAMDAIFEDLSAETILGPLKESAGPIMRQALSAVIEGSEEFNTEFFDQKANAFFEGEAGKLGKRRDELEALQLPKEEIDRILNEELRNDLFEATAGGAFSGFLLGLDDVPKEAAQAIKDNQVGKKLFDSGIGQQFTDSVLNRFGDPRLMKYAADLTEMDKAVQRDLPKAEATPAQEQERNESGEARAEANAPRPVIPPASAQPATPAQEQERNESGEARAEEQAPIVITNEDRRVDEILKGKKGKESQQVTSSDAREIAKDQALRDAFEKLTGIHLEGSLKDIVAQIRKAAEDYRGTKTEAPVQEGKVGSTPVNPDLERKGVIPPAQETPGKLNLQTPDQANPDTKTGSAPVENNLERNGEPTPAQNDSTPLNLQAPEAQAEGEEKIENEDVTPDRFAPGELTTEIRDLAMGIRDRWNSRVQAVAERGTQLQVQIAEIYERMKNNTAKPNDSEKLKYLLNEQKKNTMKTNDLTKDMGKLVRLVQMADPQMFDAIVLENGAAMQNAFPKWYNGARVRVEHDLRSNVTAAAYAYAKQKNPDKVVLTDIGEILHNRYGLSVEDANNTQLFLMHILSGSPMLSAEAIYRFVNSDTMRNPDTRDAVVNYIRDAVSQTSATALKKIIASGNAADILGTTWYFFNRTAANRARTAERSENLGNDNTRVPETRYSGANGVQAAYGPTPTPTSSQDKLNTLMQERQQSMIGNSMARFRMTIPRAVDTSMPGGKTENRAPTASMPSSAAPAQTSAQQTQVSPEESKAAYMAAIPQSVRDVAGRQIKIGRHAYNVFSYYNMRHEQNENVTLDIAAKEFRLILEGAKPQAAMNYVAKLSKTETAAAEKTKGKAKAKEGQGEAKESGKREVKGRSKTMEGAVPDATQDKTEHPRNWNDRVRLTPELPWVTRAEFVQRYLEQGKTAAEAHREFDLMMERVANDSFSTGEAEYAETVTKKSTVAKTHTKAESNKSAPNNQQNQNRPQPFRVPNVGATVESKQREIASLTSERDKIYNDPKGNAERLQEVERKLAAAQEDLATLQSRHGGTDNDIRSNDSNSAERSVNPNDSGAAGTVSAGQVGSARAEASQPGGTGGVQETGGRDLRGRRVNGIISEFSGDRDKIEYANGFVVYDSFSGDESSLTHAERSALRRAKSVGVDRVIFVDADGLYNRVYDENGNVVKVTPFEAVLIRGNVNTIIFNTARDIKNIQHEISHVMANKIGEDERKFSPERLSYLKKAMGAIFKGKKDLYIELYDYYKKIYKGAYSDKSGDELHEAILNEMYADLVNGIDRMSWLHGVSLIKSDMPTYQSAAQKFELDNRLVEYATDEAAQTQTYDSFRKNRDSANKAYSLSAKTDSMGKALSNGQVGFFRQSQARDEQGNLVRLYHGGDHYGRMIFDPTKMSDDFISLFFTDNVHIAETYMTNYKYGGEKQVRSAMAHNGQASEHITTDPSSLTPQELVDFISSLAPSSWKVGMNEVSVETEKHPFVDAFSAFTKAAIATGYLSEQTTNQLNSLLNAGINQPSDITEVLRAESAALSEIRNGSDAADYFDLSDDPAVDDKALGRAFSATRNSAEKLDSALRSATSGMPFSIDTGVGGERSASRDVMEQYARDLIADYNLQIDSGIYPVYLNLTNPLVIDAGRKQWYEIPVDQEVIDYLKSLDNSDYFFNEKAAEGTTNTRGLARYAKDHGYDGVIISNCYDIGKAGVQTSPNNVTGGFMAQPSINDYDEAYTLSNIYVAFEPEQVKDIDNLNPTENPDIRYSLSSNASMEELFDTTADPALDKQFSKATEYIPTPKQTSYINSSSVTRYTNISKDGKVVNATVRDMRDDAFRNNDEFMNQYGWTGIKTFNDFMDEVAEYLTKAEEKFQFLDFADINAATLKLDPVSNELMLTSMVKNGEYELNIDFGTICERRQALQAIVDDLLRTATYDDNGIGSVELNASTLHKINTALRDAGINTQCLICFVETKRYNQQKQFGEFTNMWDTAVRKRAAELGIEPEYFNFKNGVELSEEHIRARRAALKGYNQKGTTEEAVNALVARLPAEDLKLLDVSDIISSDGRTNIAQTFPTLNSLILKKGGSAAPKPVYAFIPYNGEIEGLTVRDTKANPLTNAEKLQRVRDHVKSIAGVRSQSFSDFIVTHVFDHLQKTGALAAKGLTAHTYTKVLARAALFGLTGEKINMSILFDVNDKVDPWYAGMSREDQSLDIDLDNPRNRPYMFSDWRARAEGAADWVQSFPWDDAVRLQNTDGYSKNVGAIGVALSYWHYKWLLADPEIRQVIGYHSSSYPAEIKQATKLGLATDYTPVQNIVKFNGFAKPNYVIPEGTPSYATAPQTVQLLPGESTRSTAVDDNPFANLKKEFAKRVKEGAKLGKSKGTVAHEFMQEILDYADDHGYVFQISKAGKKWSGHGGFDLYSDVERTQNPYDTADNFIAYCFEHGYLPMFYEFATDQNYYKQLFDFNMFDRLTYNPETGLHEDQENRQAYAPQEAVHIYDENGKLAFPGETNQDFIDTLDGYITEYDAQQGKVQDVLNNDEFMENVRGITSKQFSVSGASVRQIAETYRDLVEEYGDDAQQILLDRMREEALENEPPVQKLTNYRKVDSKETSQGTRLSKNQGAYFKNSTLRDGMGRLYEYYRGTGNFGHTFFDFSSSRSGHAMFLTNNRDVANSYAGSLTNRSYTDIDNIQPASEVAPELVSQLEDLIEEVYGTRDIQEAINSAETERDSNFLYAAENILHLADTNELEGQIERGGQLLANLMDMQDAEVSGTEDAVQSLIDLVGTATQSGTATMLVNMTHPFIIDGNGAHWTEVEVDNDMAEFLRAIGCEVTSDNRTRTNEIAKYAYAHGYDGVVIQDIYDVSVNGDNIVNRDESLDMYSDVLAVFDSNQAKDIKNTNPTNKPDFRYSIAKNVVDVNGQTYDEVVYMDTDLKSRYFRNAEFNNFVMNNFAGMEIGTVSDYGVPETIVFADAKDKDVSKHGNAHHPLTELTYGRGRNRTTRMVYLNAPEVVQISRFEGYSEQDTNPRENHQWMDRNGFEYRKAYVMDRQNIYPVILSITQADDGRSILYHAMVQKNNAVGVAFQPTSRNNPNIDFNGENQDWFARHPIASKDSIPQDGEGVNKQFAIGAQTDEENGFVPEEKIEEEAEYEAVNKQFSLWSGKEPQRVQYGFKLMSVDENGLPHAMFIDAAVPYEFGTWYKADSPKMESLWNLEPGYVYLVDNEDNVDTENRRPIERRPNGGFKGLPGKGMIDQATLEGKRWMVVDRYADGSVNIQNIGINGSGTVSTFALRPGIHAVDIPSMTHIGMKTPGSNKIDSRRPDQRWFLIEYPVDVDYNQEAYSHKTKDIREHLPERGWYSFQTNSGAEAKQHWFITGGMRIVGGVREDDVRSYARDHGFAEDLPWKLGKNYSEDNSVDLYNYIQTTSAAPTPSKAEMKQKILAEREARRAGNTFATTENANGQYRIDFDSAETPTRYSGKAEVDQIEKMYSLAGPQAKQADLGNLKEAQIMELSGSDRNKIWRNTGWYRGLDGQWRWEIYDKDFGVNRELLKRGRPDNARYGERDLNAPFDVMNSFDLPNGMSAPTSFSNADEAVKWFKAILKGTKYESEPYSVVSKWQTIGNVSSYFVRVEKQTPKYEDDMLPPLEDLPTLRLMPDLSDNDVLFLDEVLTGADRLFDNYPELRSIRVYANPLGPSVLGGYSQQGKNIEINSDMLQDEEFDVRSTLMHEIQHAIQDIEGFAHGTSPEEQRNNSPKTQKMRAQTAINSRLDFMSREDFDRLRDMAIIRAWILRNPSDTQRIAQFKSEIGWAIKEFGLGEVASFINDFEIAHGSNTGASSKGAIDRYTRTAGEVEARDVQSRLNWSEERRRKSAPKTPKNAIFNGINVFGEARSITIDPNAAYDAFGDEVEIHNTNPTDLTQSKLSPNLYYSDDTAYYQLDSGETVVMENVGEDSPEARYINFLEATNNANSTDTTTTEPYTIPPATRYESDGYNIGEQNDGLRRGAEEVPAQDQEGTLRRAGSNGKRNEPSQPQSKAAEGVSKQFSRSHFEAPFEINYKGDETFTFRNARGEPVTTLDTYPINSFEYNYILRANQGTQFELEDIINAWAQQNGKAAADESFERLKDMIDSNDDLTEEKKQQLHKQIDKAIEAYGKLPKGRGDKNNDVHLPKKTDENTAVRKFMQTGAANVESKHLSEQMMYASMTDELLGYTPQSNARSIQLARQIINNRFHGDLDKAMNWFESIVDSGELPRAEHIAMAELLIQEYSTDPNTYDKAVKVAADLSVVGTNLGQAVQAMSIIKKATPQGQLYYINSVINHLNAMYEKRINNPRDKMERITLNQALAEQLMTAGSREKINDIMEKIKQDIADQMPATIWDKWNSWRYLAMLGNPRTHIRNMLGNAAFMPAVFVKDMILRRLEQIPGWIATEDRMHTSGADLTGWATTKEHDGDSPFVKFAKRDYQTMQEIIAGKRKGNKFNDVSDILSKRRIFSNELLNTLDKKNSEWLEHEDTWFQQRYYVRALAEALQAQGFSDEDIITAMEAAGDNAQPTVFTTRDGRAALNRARQYATLQAQRDTYHEMNTFAMAINKVKSSGNPVVNVMMEGLLPFVSTPANVFVLGAIKYSPLNAIKAGLDLKKALNGDGGNVVQILDNMAAGLTGTGVMLIGAMLASFGVLRCGGSGDDDKDELEKLQGHQNWALEFESDGKGVSYTMDWAAPMSMPLFVGATIYNLLSGEMDLSSPENLWAALMGIADPLLSMSMLDGFETTLSSLKYASDSRSTSALIAAMFTSYIAQGMPTLGGQLARTLDPYRRDNYVDKNSAIPGAFQRFIQKSVMSKIPDPGNLFGQNWIPHSADDKMKHIDQWGRPDKTDGILWRAIENFISPGYANEINSTPVDDELSRLYDLTQDADILPSMLESYFSTNAGKKDLTAEEYERMMTIAGTAAHSILSEVISDERYQEADDIGKIGMIKKALEFAKEFGHYALSDDYDMPSWAETAYAMGPADYMLILDDLEMNRTHEQLFTYLTSNPYLSEDQIATVVASEYAAPDRISSSMYEGYNYNITLEDEEAMAMIFEDELKKGFERLNNDPAYINGDAFKRGDMTNNMYQDAQANTKSRYAAILDEQGRAKEVGSSTGLGNDKFEKALTLTAEELNANFGMGNIDLNTNSAENVTVYMDGKFFVLPGANEEEAVARYNETGEYFGAFNTRQQAGTYGKKIVKDESDRMAKGWTPAADDIAAQADWLAKGIKGEKLISNPDREGWNISLTKDQADERDERFKEAWGEKYREIVSSPEFNKLQTLEDQGVYLKTKATVFMEQINEAYARELYTSGKAIEEIGSPKQGSNAELRKSFDIAINSFDKLEDQAEWLSQLFNGGTSVKVPSMPGYKVKLSEDQTNLLGRNEQQLWKDLYVQTFANNNLKVKTEAERNGYLHGLVEEVEDIEQRKFYEYLNENNIPYDVELDVANASNDDFWKAVFDDQYSTDEIYDYLEQRYMAKVGTSTQNYTLDRTQRIERVEQYMEYLRSSNVVEGIMEMPEGKRASAFSRQHDAAMKYGLSGVKSEYGIKRTTEEADAARRQTPGWSTDPHLNTPLDFDNEYPVVGTPPVRTNSTTTTTTTPFVIPPASTTSTSSYTRRNSSTKRPGGTTYRRMP